MVARKTNALEKFSASLINAILVLLISTPIYFIVNDRVQWIISVVALFFLYNLYMYFFYENRCIGMMVVDTHWGEKAKFSSELLFIFLYTLSFATFFIWVWFPFDIFLINMLLQLICIKLTGTTIHGYLSGMHTIRHLNKSKNAKPFFRFVNYNIISTITFILDLVLIWFLVEIVSLHYSYAVLSGFLFATIINYVFGRKIIFKETKQKVVKGYFVGLIISALTLLSVLFFTWFFVEFVHLHYMLARILSGIIAGILGYILDIRFTFRMPVFS